MIRFGIIILLCLSARWFAAAQQKVLVFSGTSDDSDGVNHTAVAALKENASRHGFDLVFTASPLVFTPENLRNFNGVVFLNTGADGLDFRQAGELLRFFKSGGGFLGIHRAAQKQYSWLWYQKMIGAVLKDEQPEAPVQYDIITNAFIGKSSLPPLWKLTDRPLLFDRVTPEAKPVLLDLNGRVCSWYGNSGLGNKFFYTSFGGTEAVFKNQVFIDHIFSGLQEVCPTQLPGYDDSEADVIPEDKNFAVVRLVDGLNQPLAMKAGPKGHVYILQSGGKFLYYDSELKKLNDFGSFSLLSRSVDFSFDPEFESNGYIYFYDPPSAEGSVPIRRLKTGSKGQVEISDFGTQHSSGPRTGLIYRPEQFISGGFKLPAYYQHKVFKYDAGSGLRVETRGAGNELLNVEPFLPGKKIGTVKDMDFSSNGELLLLENDGLKKVIYAENGVFPPVAKAVADQTRGSVPLKVSFDAGQSYDLQQQPLSYSWTFTDKDSSPARAPVFIFRKPGLSRIKLEVKNAAGLSDEVVLQIEAEAPKRKR